MSHTISFTVYESGWYSSYDDIDMWAYQSPVGWTLVYWDNSTIKGKVKLLASDSVQDIIHKVLELTGKEMRFTVYGDNC